MFIFSQKDIIYDQALLKSLLQILDLSSEEVLF